MTEAEKQELVRRAKNLLLVGEVIDLSTGQVIGRPFLPFSIIRRTVRIRDVQIDGSFGESDDPIWMDICVGYDQVYGENEDTHWDNEDKGLHALGVLRQAMVLDDLSHA